MAPTKQMLNIAIKNKPNYVCIVPEKRKEITTEGGLNVKKNKKKMKRIINELKKRKIRISLFIEPQISHIRLSKILGANCVELHTGKFCNLLHKNNRIKSSFMNLKKSANYAKQLGLEVHAGHGLTYKSASHVAKIKSISEFNIGHFIISESLFVGMPKSIKRFRKILNK
jgi:pyridoxine 5-phosphate synthase